ncbi:monofunctional biosynthetic peptidoglycan transglycosylase [Oryzifoliimicrobium ureilyticus]|uniref:monofunctional biosynthetic peptidoglycan transglycosylase n=1 Tax=Oryzifoliimicrobium ureilyticus TaxID=3113724 RepID=UPI00307627C6
MDVTTEQDSATVAPAYRRVTAWLKGRSLVQRIFLALIALFLLPYVLIVLYLPSFVHPVSTLMIRDLALLRGYDRQWVSIDDISPVLIKSVMMSEDGQFCYHHGVDWGEMRGLVQDTLSGESTRGGSTIPMQTVKNLFLWNSRSFVRKGLELPLAVTADFIWSKRRMMEVYLNIAEWGPGIYGIEAAARHHFRIPASKLTPRQAALLAVSLPNPFNRVASRPGRGMRNLAAIIERRARGADEYARCIF